jgi:hypothetical protein
MKQNKRVVAPAAILLFILTAPAAMAQSTIFNVPTTDTVAKGKGYFEFDFLPQAPGTSSARTYIYNPRFVAGIANNLEAGANFFTAHTAGGVYCGTAETCAYFQPNIKFKYYNSDAAGVALAAGILWNTPMNQRNVQDSWGYVYANVSKKVKTGNYGPRFTAGPYGVVGANQDMAEGATSFLDQPRAGVILGYEQPVHTKASIVADWFSGKNGLGYFTPGISITLPHNGLFNAGYSFGNDSWADDNATKNRYVFVYYGVTF